MTDKMASLHAQAAEQSRALQSRVAYNQKRFTADSDLAAKQMKNCSCLRLIFPSVSTAGNGEPAAVNQDGDGQCADSIQDADIHGSTEANCWHLTYEHGANNASYTRPWLYGWWRIDGWY